MGCASSVQLPLEKIRSAVSDRMSLAKPIHASASRASSAPLQRLQRLEISAQGTHSWLPFTLRRQIALMWSLFWAVPQRVLIVSRSMEVSPTVNVPFAAIVDKNDSMLLVFTISRRSSSTGGVAPRIQSPNSV